MNFNLENFDEEEEENDIDQEVEQAADNHDNDDDDDDDDNNNYDNDDDDDDDDNDENVDVQEDKDDDDDDNDNEEDALDHEAHEVIPAIDSPNRWFSRRSEIINTLFQKLNNPITGNSSDFSSNTFSYVSKAAAEKPSLQPSEDGFLAWMKEKNRRKARDLGESLEKDRLIEKPTRSLWKDLRIGSESKEDEDEEEEEEQEGDDDDDNVDEENEDKYDEIESENDEDDDNVKDLFDLEQEESDEKNSGQENHHDSEEKSPDDSTKQSQSDKSAGIIDQPRVSEANSKTAKILLKTDSTSSSSASSSRLSDSAIEEASLQPLSEKLRTFKRFRQTLIHTASLAASARRFLCEIIYDQIEEEVAVKMKYLPATIGYMFFSKALTIRFLCRMIEDKEMRASKAKDIMRILASDGISRGNKEKQKKKEKKLNRRTAAATTTASSLGRISKKIQNDEQQQQSKLLLQQPMSALRQSSSYNSIYTLSKQQSETKKIERIMKTKEQQNSQIKKLTSSKDDKLFFSSRIMQWLGECKAKSSDPEQQFRILQQLNQRRHSLSGYQSCQILREILSDILSSASMKYFNNSKISELITPFLLETDISISFFVKCLLKQHKHAILFSTPARIVAALAQRHKSLLA